MAMAFYATFLDHDETAALEVLRRVPVTVVAATHDRLTPAAHGRRIAEAIGENAELVVVPGRRAQRQPHPHRTSSTRRFTDLLDRVEARRRRESRLTRRPRGHVEVWSRPHRLSLRVPGDTPNFSGHPTTWNGPGPSSATGAARSRTWTG